LEFKLPSSLFRYGVIQIEQNKLLILGGRNEEMNEISKKAFTMDITNGEINFTQDLQFPCYTTRRLHVYDDMITIFHDEEFLDIPLIANYHPPIESYSNIY
jgi:hypothetical protein